MITTERKRIKSPHQPVGRWIRVDKRLAIYLRDGFTCQICLRNLHNAKPDNITLDHYKPRSKNGSNSERNIFTCCKSCNSSRKATQLPATIATRVRLVMRVSLTRYRTLAKSLLHPNYTTHFKAVQKHVRKGNRL